MVSNLAGVLKRKAQTAARLLKHALRRPDYGPKIFCVGFNKTGTTTLGRSLAALGFWHSSYNGRVFRELYKRGNIEAVLRYTAKYDSFDDLPWLKEDMIPVLDRTFPGSKFVYLERKENAWKQSIHKWHYKQKGSYPNVEEKWEEYLAHRDFIEGYFAEAGPDRFLRLTIDDPQGYSKLGAFVGRETPTPHFPHHNQTSKLRPRSA